MDYFRIVSVSWRFRSRCANAPTRRASTFGMRIYKTVLLFITFIPPAFVARSPKYPVTAVERFHDLREHLQQDRKNSDLKVALEHAKALKKLLNGSPHSRLEVARTELHSIGNPTTKFFWSLRFLQNRRSGSTWNA